MSKRQRGSEVSNQADVARRGLVSVNRLDYTLQPDLSVAVARSSKKHFFQQSEYTPGQRAICILNSGAEYFDPQNSYLKFDVTISNTGLSTNARDTYGLFLGAGSACNFIRQITLTSRSGDEIERIEQVNQLATQLDRYMHSQDWLQTHGEMIGYANYSEANATAVAATNSRFNTRSQTEPGFYRGEAVSAVTHNPKTGKLLQPPGTDATDEVKHTFVIPLSCLSGLFKSFDRLVPSMLASGMRIEIEFESASEVGRWGANANQAYTITEPEIVLDQYQLTDSIMRVLNEEAALRGLEVVFSTWYNHDVSVSGTNINVQIRKAVSRALGILSRMIIPRGIGSGETHKFVSVKPDYTKYQVRVGALYFPQQGIVSDNVQRNLKELYHHTMRGLGKWKTPSAPSSVSLWDYRGQGLNDDTGVYADGSLTDNIQNVSSLCSVYTDLERSNTQKLTGIPVNNARVAEIFITRNADDPSAVGTRLNSYLHYVKLLRVFLQNVEVEE